MNYIGVRIEPQRLTEVGRKLSGHTGIEATYTTSGGDGYLFVHAESERAVRRAVDSVDGAVRVVGVAPESETREENLTQITEEFPAQRDRQQVEGEELVEEWKDADMLRVTKGEYEGQRGQLRKIRKDTGELVLRMSHPLIEPLLRFDPDRVERVN